MKGSKLLLLVCCVLGAAGCALFSDRAELIFTYDESAHGTVITPAVDVSALSGNEIVFVGQLNTPRPCYRLEGDLDVDGSQVTLTINARQTQSQNCETIVGRFIYQGSIRRLDAGTYQVLFRHVFDNAAFPTQEFEFSVTVR